MNTPKEATTGKPAVKRPELRVSVVEYLNTAPLVWGLDKAVAEHEEAAESLILERHVPTQCAEALRRGTVDLGIIPAIEYQRIPGLKILPGISVSSDARVESVLLICRGPVRKAKKVALDASSRTSVALVQILFEKHWGMQPEYVEAAPDLKAMLSEAKAALLIGDPALQFSLRSKNSPLNNWERAENLHVYDLADEWKKLTNLPFVFALWAARPEKLAEPEQAQRLTKIFQRARFAGLQHLPEIARKAGAKLGLPGGELERYLRHSIHYGLDERYRAGLELYFKYAHELGLIDEVHPLEFL